MHTFARITLNPAQMAGRPCIRGMRVTVGNLLGQLAAGRSQAEILADYPYLEAADIAESLAYAAWRLQEQEHDLAA